MGRIKKKGGSIVYQIKLPYILYSLDIRINMSLMHNFKVEKIT